MKDFMELALSRRSIRRFTTERIRREHLLDLVRAGMSAPSAGNGQPCRFIIVDDTQTVKRINKNLGWLGGAPEDDQQPTAHVVILLANPEKRWALYADAGAAGAAISLAAAEKGIGSCWIGSVNRDEVAGLLEVPDSLEVFSVLALGYPAEEPNAVEVDTLDKPSVKRDEAGKLTVQKLTLNAVCYLGRFGHPLD